MLILLKISGAILMVIASWGVSLYITFEYKSKMDTLFDFCIKLKEVRNQIRLGAGEISPIINNVFKDTQYINSKGLIPTVKEECFFKKDAITVKNLLKDLGVSDRAGECEKIETYLEILNDRYEQTQTEYKAKSKVCQTVALSAGIAVAVIII